MSLHDLFTAPSSLLTVLEDPHGVGVFVQAATTIPDSRWQVALGDLKDLRRFTLCHRYEPFWMEPKAGTTSADVPPETQWLLAQRTTGDYVLIVPLAAGQARASLSGSDTGLEILVETGDSQLKIAQALACFVAVGTEPYTLLAEAAVSVRFRLETGRLREEKPVPPFIESFGWCTWDAFYQDVSQEKVREGLQSFAEGGVEPRYLILDDGWQSVTKKESGETQLSAFAANEKFPGDLSATVTMAKDEFAIETFLVWHAVGGYWGGVDASSLSGYGVQSVTRQSSPGIKHYQPGVDLWWGPTVGVVSPEGIYRFYQDYHRHLREQGVDGVKVDNQASLESVAEGLGGRVPLMRAYREALEGSVAVHFSGNLINCMSNANEMHLQTLASTLTRTSTDFWPKRPETHGLHLYTNAQVSLWFGQFVHPDWDMFQSGHEAGPYHAAGRALSGGPVYVSDKPDGHNFDLLKRLVLPDGRILRCDNPGLPSPSCLFDDPTRTDVPLKIANASPEDAQYAGYLGLFNARYDAENPITVSGEYGVSDLLPHDALGDTDQWALYLHQADQLLTLRRSETRRMSLPPLGFEFITFVPVEQGVAPLGLLGMFCGASAVALRGATESEVFFQATEAGTHLVSCERKPRVVHDGESPLAFRFDRKKRRLEVELDEPCWVYLVFAE